MTVQKTDRIPASSDSGKAIDKQPTPDRPVVRLVALRKDYSLADANTRWGNYRRLGKCWFITKEIETFPGERHRFDQECKFKKLKFHKDTPLLQRVCRYVLHNEEEKKVNNYAAALLKAPDTFKTPEDVATWLKTRGIQKHRTKNPSKPDSPVALKLRNWRQGYDGIGDEATIPREKIPMKHRNRAVQIVALLTEDARQPTGYVVTAYLSEPEAVVRVINIMSKYVNLHEIPSKRAAQDKKAA